MFPRGPVQVEDVNTLRYGLFGTNSRLLMFKLSMVFNKEYNIFFPGQIFF
jgi:hypothetical protein